MLSTSADFWMAFLVSVPILTVCYYFLVVMVGLRRYGHYVGYLYRSSHDLALMIPFYVVVGTAVLLLSPTDVPLEFEPAYLVGLPAGVLLYRLENAAWARVANGSLERGTRDLRWVLPVVVIPLAEELIFRGGYLVFLRRFGTTGYVALSAVAFALVHGFQARRELVTKTVDGALYATITVATGSVVPAIMLHTGFNVGFVHWVTSEPGLRASVLSRRRDSP